jgi:hypothetical protein
VTADGDHVAGDAQTPNVSGLYKPTAAQFICACCDMPKSVNNRCQASSSHADIDIMCGGPTVYDVDAKICKGCVERFKAHASPRGARAVAGQAPAQDDTVDVSVSSTFPFFADSISYLTLHILFSQTSIPPHGITGRSWRATAPSLDHRAAGLTRPPPHRQLGRLSW